MRGRLHFLTPCMTRSVTTHEVGTVCTDMPATHIYTHSTTICLCSLHHPLSLFFFCVVRYFPNPTSSSSSAFRASLGESHQDNYLHTGIQGTGICLSFCWPPPASPTFFFPFASSSPPPEHTFHFFCHPQHAPPLSSLLSSPLLLLFLSSPYAHAVCLLTRASLPFISHFTVFANCKHILHKLKGEKKTLRGGNKAEMKADEEKREELLKILQERQKVENMHILCGVCFFHGSRTYLCFRLQLLKTRESKKWYAAACCKLYDLCISRTSGCRSVWYHFTCSHYQVKPLISNVSFSVWCKEQTWFYGLCK